MKRSDPVADLFWIWNADETGFCLGSTSKKILERRAYPCINKWCKFDPVTGWPFVTFEN